jgi:3-hydroxy-9,10-secoandrosta-1,3,5(10)-triene-9,17-dione monooxygenase
MAASPETVEHDGRTLDRTAQRTGEQVVSEARTIAADLVARQAETEERTYYAPDTHRRFADAGFYRILVPRRYGGLELGAETFLQVCTALARGCPSTGWMYCFGAAHALVAATLFGEQAQEELFRDGDFICPATVAPSGTAERAADGSWVVNGTFAYCSGSPYATWFIGHTLVASGPGGAPEPALFAIPRSGFRRLDDWGAQLGLKGSGSHSIVIENGRVPAHRLIPRLHLSQVAVDRGTAGRAIHGNPEYGGGPVSFMLLEPAAVAVGMAQGALDAYEELMRTRNTSFLPIVPRSQDPDFQFWYGQASGMIAAAEAALAGAAHRWSQTCRQGPQAFSREQDLRIATICREVIGLCWRAVESHLFPTAGSSSVRHGERIERVWRDLSMMHSHAGFAIFLSTAVNRELAKEHFAPAPGGSA